MQYILRGSVGFRIFSHSSCFFRLISSMALLLTNDFNDMINNSLKGKKIRVNILVKMAFQKKLRNTLENIVTPPKTKREMIKADVSYLIKNSMS